MTCGMPLYGDPEYPVFDPSVTDKMLHTSANGRDILLVNNQKVICFDSIAKQILKNSVCDPDNKPPYNSHYDSILMIRKWGELNIKNKPFWEHDCGEAFAMVRCKNAIIFSAISSDETGSKVHISNKEPQKYLIEALDINNGKRLWSQPLISPPLSWGLIVDSNGRIIVTLKDGQIMCFG